MGKPRTDDFTAPTTQEEFDKMIGPRLERERAKYADHDELKAKAEKYDQLTKDGKNPAEQHADELAQIRTELADERVLRLKAEVAAERGLTKSQAKRLQGTTLEELNADADDLLEAFPAPEQAGGEDDGSTPTPKAKTPPPARKPKEALQGTQGADEPDPVETDVKKIGEEMFSR